MNHFDAVLPTSRRAFVRNGSLCLLGACIGMSKGKELFADDAPPKVRLGLITDLHYADKPPAGTRYYRESLTKLEEAATQFKKDQPDLVVELGDLIDAAETVEAEQEYLRRIQQDFLKLPGKKHYVLGNHCVTTLTKQELLSGVGRRDSYYSFDFGGFHFVVLDACFRSDGESYGRNNFQWTDANVPAAELAWLQDDLKAARAKTIVFVHQRLDESRHHSVKNAAQVRQVLQDSGKVLAVFQGHSHRNDHQEIAGIHYCVVAAMVEGSGAQNNSYATVDILADDAIRIHGYRRQKNYAWS